MSFLRTLVRMLLTGLFLFAGAVHLRYPGLFLPVMPPWIPWPRACILVSGIFEILGGVGLLAPAGRLRMAAGWGLTLLLVAVFPANVYMAVADVRVHGFPSHAWMAWARLPVQPVLIAAVLWVTGAWPGTCNMGKTKDRTPSM